MEQVIVIPTIDPTAALVMLVGALQDRGFSRFIVVDDGSDASHWLAFSRLDERGCVVLHHDENRGKGAAIKTALNIVGSRFPDASGIITVDGDGQHLPDDVLRVARYAEDHPGRIVLGIRDLRSRFVPRRSHVGSWFSSLFFRLDTGIRCPDTQTGLRFIPRFLLQFARSIPANRYDYEMDFLICAAKRGLGLDMVPIATVYENGNRGTHFRAVADSYLIFRSFIRFALSSLSCAGVDLGLFALITLLLPPEAPLTIAAATVMARCASGGFNFLINRHWSFEVSGDKMPLQLGRYILLFVCQMVASAGGVTLLSLLPLPLIPIKMVVDGSLFVFSYFLQRNWVFVKRRDKDQEKSVEAYG